ncbi:MAG: iron-sulfur cluster assembly scaffold protein, partial [Oligoflexus sp.]
MNQGSDSTWKGMILDHYKQPRHFRRPTTLIAETEEHNRTCGDHVHIYLAPGTTPERGSLEFQGAGCSLCIASASLMCSLLQDRSQDEARGVLSKFQEVWSQGANTRDSIDWQVIGGLRQYPVRSRCV